MKDKSMVGPELDGAEDSVGDGEEKALTRLDGGRLDTAELRGRVVLVVNVASECGFTPQYAGLQRLHARYAERGFTVLGVPCNQFGDQEPGTAAEIAQTCELRFGVTFPMLAKQDVRGDTRSPLYARLLASTVGAGREVEWNFEKFLVGRDGRVLERFTSNIEPESIEIEAAVERALGTLAP